MRIFSVDLLADKGQSAPEPIRLTKAETAVQARSAKKAIVGLFDKLILYVGGPLTGWTVTSIFDENALPKGWLRLDFVFDYLHQGTITSENRVSEVVVLPAETVKEHDKIGDVLLRFSQTPDRAFVVVAPDGKYVGTISLLDVVLASQEVTEVKP